jgi:hypothetical protein
MNIEPIFPDSDLQVYKVTNVLTEGQVKLLAKLAQGRIPTGFKADELNEAVSDIRAASIEACQAIFGMDDLSASEENKRWPWFDLSEGDERGYERNKIFNNGKAFFAEFVVQSSTNGGETVFKDAENHAIKLAPGEMLVASRSAGHEVKIAEIKSGLRFTLMTHVYAK